MVYLLELKIVIANTSKLELYIHTHYFTGLLIWNITLNIHEFITPLDHYNELQKKMYFCKLNLYFDSCPFVNYTNISFYY